VHTACVALRTGVHIRAAGAARLGGVEGQDGREMAGKSQRSEERGCGWHDA